MAHVRPRHESQRLDVHVYAESSSVGEKLDRILSLLGVLQTQQQEHHMAVSAQIQAFSERVNLATNELAADLQALRDKIAAGTALTPEDVAVLDGIATQLEAMGKDPENPIPNV